MIVAGVFACATGEPLAVVGSQADGWTIRRLEADSVDGVLYDDPMTAARVARAFDPLDPEAGVDLYPDDPLPFDPGLDEHPLT